MCCDVEIARSPTDTLAAADYEDLYRAELPGLIALGLSLSGSREAGRDAAQEALLRAYRQWPTVRELERPGAWLRRVLINLCIDQQRRTRRERRSLSLLHPRDPVPHDSVAPLEDFWRAVRRLPTRQQAVVALRFVEDLTVEEVAAVLELSPATASRDLSAARTSLSRALDIQEGR